MITLKLTQIGNSTGVVLPKEALEKLRVEKGDVIYLTETPEGYSLTPYSQDFEDQMKAMQSVMKQYRNTLRELAK
jgi:putative addiction module antidote